MGLLHKVDLPEYKKEVNDLIDAGKWDEAKNKIKEYLVCLNDDEE